MQTSLQQLDYATVLKSFRAAAEGSRIVRLTFLESFNAIRGAARFIAHARVYGIQFPDSGLFFALDTNGQAVWPEDGRTFEVEFPRDANSGHEMIAVLTQYCWRHLESIEVLD